MKNEHATIMISLFFIHFCSQELTHFLDYVPCLWAVSKLNINKAIIVPACCTIGLVQMQRFARAKEFVINSNFLVPLIRQIWLILVSACSVGHWSSFHPHKFSVLNKV